MPKPTENNIVKFIFSYYLAKLFFKIPNVLLIMIYISSLSGGREVPNSLLITTRNIKTIFGEACFIK